MLIAYGDFLKLIKTGIKGLDAVLDGGLRENSSVLLTGSPGTGKTIFALQFICEGARKGEPGLYITFEESIDSVREYASSVGIDLDEYERQGLITLVQQRISDKKLMTISAPISVINQKNIKRVALDSLTLFEYIHVAGTMDFRKEVLDFILKMKAAGVTLVATSQKSVVDLDALDYQPQDFLFEGVILLSKIRKASSFERCINVVKLRGQKHSIDIYPFSIGKGGIDVHNKQVPFSLIEQDSDKFEK